ncbi:MAG: EamA family transporter RarD [Micrococcales bacterium]|nr:EamA family transporter RarD [Micrococcales bacterium]
MSQQRYREGLVLATASYVWWGFLPLYLRLAAPTGTFELIAQRVVWSLLVCLVLLTATGQWRAFTKAATKGRTVGKLAVAGSLLMVNWTTFVYAAMTSQLIDAALGYFLNPLVSVALGVGLLAERLRPLQWVAIAVSTFGVLALWLSANHFPWISLVLAVTFGLYGYIEKTAGAGIPAIATLAVETAVLVPPALVFLAWWTWAGRQTFTGFGVGHELVMVGLGLATVLPLWLANAAFRRLPLSVMGQIQFLGPTLQFLTGLLILHEEMPMARWVGFATVWAALLLTGYDAWRQARQTRASLLIS